jgi:hypothetical protein
MIIALAWGIAPGLMGMVHRAGGQDCARGDFVRQAGGGSARVWWHRGGAAMVRNVARSCFAGLVLVAFESAALMLYARVMGFATLGPLALDLANTPGAESLAYLIALGGMCAAGMACALGARYAWFGPIGAGDE